MARIQKCTLRRFALSLLCVTLPVGSASGWTSSASAANAATVYLLDGRVVRGVVDSRTSRQWLWLITDQPDLSLLSRFDWTQVVEVRAGGRQFSRAQYLSHIHGEGDDPSTGDGSSLRRLDQLGTSHPLTLPAPGSEVLPQPIPSVIPPARPHFSVDLHSVQSVWISAHVANWDRDLAPDGLRVLVAPLDRSGHMVPVASSIDFRLLALRQRTSGGQRVRRGYGVVSLGEWSRRIRTDDYGPQGYFCELPFRNFQPDRDLNVAAEGELGARLGVPGAGVFHATQELVLRPPSRHRDALQLRTGRRTLGFPFAPIRRHPVPPPIP